MFGYGWIPGCYGLKYPAVVVGAIGLVYRGKEENLEILVGMRVKGRWESETLTIAPGGFLDPDDSSPQHCAIREVFEETGVRAIAETPLFHESGPAQYRWRWDAASQCAIRINDTPIMEIPIVTLNYLLRYNHGEPHSTEELQDVKWVRLADFVRSDHNNLSFDQAKTLEEALKAFRKIGIL